MEEKIILRKKYFKKRKDLTTEFVKEKSLEIQKKFLNNDLYKNSKNICVYIDYNNEVKTDYIISQSLKDGKYVYIPKIEKDIMEFIQIDENTEYRLNKYNIKEPLTSEREFSEDENKSVFLVPGVVFSKEKYRIGYGGGFYDKWISENSKSIYIGLSYEFQIVDCFKKEYFDQKLKYIITEKQIIL